ncbi:molecular chaperone DnaJ [Candidatus Pacearchaeota archaeon]|nr:molecular chaperone DnaJ [Candidatus Pacearchaeota archaeon]
MAEDYYKILGVTKTATDEEIKKSYKKLAKKYHPDVSKESGAESKFKELSEAYAVLSDKQKRQQYDSFGKEGFQQRYSSEDIFRGFDPSQFEDLFGGSIFDSFFGGGRRSRSKRGRDLSVLVTLTFDEAMKGVQKELRIRKQDKCGDCDGSGAENGTLESCPDCNGSGQVRKSTRTPFGSFMQVGLCSECSGQGKIPKKVCKSCDGSGHAEITKEITTKIPAGVDSGSTLRVSGEGEYGGRGSSSGDLYINIEVETSDVFRREGNDLYLNLPLTFTQAALGCELKVPTLRKEVTIKINSGTQSGTHIRLKNEGAPDVNGYDRGNIYVVLEVMTPVKLSKEQKQLFEKLGKLDEHKSILDKIKDWAKK